MVKQKALTVSIVIPVYNEESYLAACLEAISAQSVKPNEVIVVDNNSTDATIDIARSYPFVKVIVEKKQGVVHARDRGFNAAKSDIIGRIDADTLLPPDWVHTVMYIFRDTQLAGVSGPVSYYDMPLEPLNFRIDMTLRGIADKANSTSWLFGTNMALRKDAWKAVQQQICHNPIVHEDLDLAIHLQVLDELVRYDPNLRARMSARRFDDSLPAFYAYLRMHHHTFDLHEIKTSLPHIALVIYLFFYAIMKPVRKSYNIQTNTYSLKHFIFGYNQPRKNPMTD